MLWVRPQLVDLVKQAIRQIGYVNGERALLTVAPLVSQQTGSDVADEINALKAIKRIEKAAIKKAAKIGRRAAIAGVPISPKRAAKKAVVTVLRIKAPGLLKVAGRAA